MNLYILSAVGVALFLCLVMFAGGFMRMYQRKDPVGFFFVGFCVAVLTIVALLSAGGVK